MPPDLPPSYDEIVTVLEGVDLRLEIDNDVELRPPTPTPPPPPPTYDDIFHVPIQNQHQNLHYHLARIFECCVWNIAINLITLCFVQPPFNLELNVVVIVYMLAAMCVAFKQNVDVIEKFMLTTVYISMFLLIMIVVTVSVNVQLFGSIFNVCAALLVEVVLLAELQATLYLLDNLGDELDEMPAPVIA